MGNVVVYVAGGAMSGIFSAGVLSYLKDLGVREHVSAIYGISAGAFNAALFATGQTHRIPEWYWTHVPREGIIRTTNPIRALMGEEVLDSARALEVLLQKHLINPEELLEMNTPIFFGLVDADSKEFVWKDARRPDVLQLLLATTAFYPFAHHPVPIDGKNFVDWGYGETVALHSLRARHPNSKILIILNQRIGSFSWRRSVAYGVMRYRDSTFAQLWSETIDKAKDEFAIALASPDALVIYPPEEFAVDAGTTDIEELRKGYAHGYHTAASAREAIQQFLQLNVTH